MADIGGVMLRQKPAGLDCQNGDVYANLVPQHFCTYIVIQLASCYTTPPRTYTFRVDTSS